MTISISRRLASEYGSAILEFLVFGLAINLAILTFGTELIQTQKSQFAVESIARHVIRDLSRGADQTQAQQLALEIADGFELETSRLQIATACVPDDCLGAEAQVQILVSYKQAKARAVMPIAESDQGTEE